jgi:NAD(P)-dependent dehydrogenase (short-subunit alcohol dehydrogenase family)
MELRGKRVLITGASRGIGEAFAHAFTGAGATVALVARTEDSLRALAAKLGGTAHPADLSDSTQVATLVQRVEDEAGPVDVLVNNAGIESTAGFADAPDDELRRVTEVNYLAPQNCAGRRSLECFAAAAGTSSTCPHWPVSQCSRAS